MSIRKGLAIVLALSWLAVAMTGCNTIEGAGKDVKAAGGAVEKAAAKNEPY